MTRKTLNAVVDALAFAGFVLLAASGVLLRWSLPPGSGHRTTIWGLDRHDWGAVHFWIAVALLAVLVVHLLLHWKWIAAVASRGGVHEPSGLRVALGVVGLAGLIGFAVAPFVSPVERAGRQTPDASHDGGERIRGAQWLAVLLSITGLLLIFEPWHVRGGLFSQVLAVMAGMFWAVSVILAKQLMKREEIPLLGLTAWQMLFGAIPLVIVAFFVPEGPVNWTSSFVAALLYNVIPGNAVAWLLWLYILEKLPAGVAGMGSLIIPVVGVLSAWLQLGERPGPFEAAGMVLIGVALLILSIYALRAEKPYHL